MVALNYNNFMVNLANEIDALTNHFVFDGYNALATLLRAPLGSLIVLYIILMGYAMLRGLVQTPRHELLKFAVRAGTIYMCAMNWDFFANHIKDLFVISSESIGTTLMQAFHAKSSHASINQGLQNVLNEILRLGGDLFDMGSLKKLTPYFAGMMVFFSGSITIGLAFIEIVIAKLMLAITLCTAPLFIIFTLFEQTKSIFERWLGVLVGFSLVLVFVSSVVGLCIHLLHWMAINLVNNQNQLQAAIWVPLFIVSCLCVMGILEAVAIGKSIGGAICTSGGAAMVGGFVGASVGTWAFSKNSIQKHVNFSGLLKNTRAAFSSTANFQKMQQNLRQGTS